MDPASFRSLPMSLFFHLHIECGCKATKIVHLRDIPFQPGETIGERVDKLRCKNCKGRPTSVHVSDISVKPGSFGMEPTVWVDIAGKTSP